MAVTRSQYVRELEGRIAKGKSFEEAHKKAAKKATIRKKSKYDEKMVKKVARKLYEIFYGPKAYIKKEFKPTGKKKFKTVRTKAVEKGLKRGGLTEKEIARFRD